MTKIGDDLIIRIKADTEFKSLKDLDKELDRNERLVRAANLEWGKNQKAVDGAAASHRRAAESTKKFSDTMWGVVVGTNQFLSILGRVKGSVEHTFKMFEDAARTAAAKRYFEEAGKSIDRLRDASRGLVSDAKLVKKANLADTMGLSQDTFVSLLKTAQAASAKTGQSFEHMFDSIVVGTARSSRLLLDNLGIIVSVKEANRKLAEEYQRDSRYQHMSIAQIIKLFDDEAKKIAFVEEVARKSAGAVNEMNRIGETGAEVYDRFTAALENLKQAIGEAVPVKGLIGALTQIAEAMTTIVEAYDSLRGQDAAQLISSVLQGFMPANFLGEVAGRRADAAGLVQKAKDDKFDEALRRQQALNAMFKNLGMSIDFVVNASEIQLKQLEQATQSNVGAMVREWRKLDQVLGGSATTRHQKKTGNRPELDPNKEDGTGVDHASKIRALLKKFGEEWNKAWELEERELLDYWSSFWKDWFTQMEARFKAQAEKAAKNIAWRPGRPIITSDAAGNQYSPSGAMLGVDDGGARQDREDLAEFRRQQQAARDTAAAGNINTLGALVSGDAGAFASALGAAIGAAFGAPQVGAAIGQLIGPFLEGLEPFMNLITLITQGFAQLVNIALTPLMAALEPLGPALFMLLASVGVLIASAINPFIPAIQAAVAVLTIFFGAISWAVVVLSPIVEMFITVAFALWSVGLSLLGLFLPVQNLASAFEFANDIMISDAIAFNNAIVKFVRTILGNKKFGDILTKSDFKPKYDLPAPDEIDSLGSNTDATKENTQALRDLARELHNMPAGYKSEGALYAASDPEPVGPMRGGRGWLGRAPKGRTIEMSRMPRSNDWR